MSFVFFEDSYDYQNIELSMSKSNVKFLSVLYKHHRLLHTIDIHIPECMYIEHGALLSPLFIKKYLEEQREPFIFDMNYSLEIIDSHIKTFSLKSNEYIYLHKNTYTIVKSRKTS